MQIDCSQCPDRVGDVPCEDCLVTFVLSLEDDSAIVEGAEGAEGVVVDAAEARAIHLLADAGLLPRPRLVPRKEAG